MFIDLTVVVASYVADPYRPARERVINAQKESGMNRARSSANRRKALEQYLVGVGMTLAEYEQLVAEAATAWDVDDAGRIVIPARNVTAMVVATCYQARSAFRPCAPETARALIVPSEWHTDVKPEQAGTWERFAVVNAGTGTKLSNQRGLRQNLYIGAAPPDPACLPTAPVTATGTVAIREDMVEPDVLGQALGWAGQWVGIGSSRKMGWGRFEITRFTPQ